MTYDIGQYRMLTLTQITVSLVIQSLKRDYYNRAYPNHIICTYIHGSFQQPMTLKTYTAFCSTVLSFLPNN